MAGKQTVAQAAALLNARRFAEAAELIESAAKAGEAAALVQLANWRISGDLIRRDLAAARDLLGRAAAAGERDAALLHAYFLASGTGGPDDWQGAVAELRALAPRDPRATEQLRLLDQMANGPDGLPSRPLERSQLSVEPFVASCTAFLTAAECEYLKKAGEPALQPSVIVDPATRQMVPHPIRRSDGTAFGVYAEDMVVNAINRRIAALSETSLEQGEPLQLLRYRPGGEYRAHMDALPAEPNQRILTVIVYLTDDYEGGETSFLRTGTSFRGKRGDALMFRNVTPDGQPDPAALHAGLPVTRGTKLIASRWIRQRRFTYPPPRALLDR